MTRLTPTSASSSARLPLAPPEGWEPLLKLAGHTRRPLDRFLRLEAAGGILLFVAAGVALAFANSPWAEGYQRWWHTMVGIRFGSFTFERSLAWCVNDGLMVIFFFVVGLEIRGELHHGSLSEWRRAALPAVAALGGMIAPAGLYLIVARDAGARSGWGIPMATDIAFALGVLSVLGRRVPPPLRMLLLALAVIDDVGAIVVIALFYSSGIELSGLLVAGIGLAVLFAMQGFGVRAKVAYIAPAVVVWGGIYAAGIHPTIAGVIIGLVTPVRAWFGPRGFVERVQKELEELSHSTPESLSSHELSPRLQRVDIARREAVSPAEHLIETLHPWMAFAIMPIFALANAGVPLSGFSLEGASWSVVAGTVLGLCLGKPVGILLAAWLMLRFGIGTLPTGVTLRHLLVLGIVAGVGFTMALFIAQLAFSDPTLLAAAKIGVLAASGAAAIAAVVLGYVLLASAPPTGPTSTAGEAERPANT